jgi:hypothetical protein
VLTDEMVLDFDQWTNCIDTYWQQQAAGLTTLNDFLGQMSTSHEATFWEEEALFIDPRWDKARVLAKTALTSFGWAVEAPPPIYWSGDALIG